MIVIVEIIAGRLMRETLTRQECQLVAMLETNKGSGAISCHLETQLTESNECAKQTVAYL